MSTTSSTTPSTTPAPVPPATSPSPPAPEEGVVRSARLIHNEATTEIPVHLLFRDDPAPAPVPLRPAVVERRQGTGEQPRMRRP
ncbi:SPFH domain-containing protein, partial [Streptomyces sp. SID5910]|nr:SPFH domain-containing protein [Streptomyces sp. SID5910]